MSSLDTFAATLDDAALTASATPQITATYPDLSVDEAYEVQLKLLQLRWARGECRVGYKMGLTSRAKMIQVGVSEIIWGRLTDAMRQEEGGVLKRSRFVHPRVEPEIAYIIGKPLAGNVSAAEALAAIEAIAPAMEIIDSRYQNFKFALPDVIADNSSSSGFYVGSWAPKSTDVTNLGIIMEVNGRPVQIGSSAAILGNPIRSLVSAARLVAGVGESLQPGDIVLAGAATAAHALTPGEYIRTSFQRLGHVAFSVGA
ncbi:2-keto-4-pentenoate hydratase [Acidocella sp.]|uniref:2-keto-4-pentenoate hydratase n=1 Tax=Acidocella sp. TaxID=50710 RepID=UPI0017F4A3FC|nr:fumarylacetoacetate hydrolase family protein [Acidocella sp.]NNM56912.1 4-oxalocrotonate decarboxylase [Acidocella sp.]